MLCVWFHESNAQCSADLCIFIRSLTIRILAVPMSHCWVKLSIAMNRTHFTCMNTHTQTHRIGRGLYWLPAICCDLMFTFYKSDFRILYTDCIDWNVYVWTTQLIRSVCFKSWQLDRLSLPAPDYRHHFVSLARICNRNGFDDDFLRLPYRIHSSIHASWFGLGSPFHILVYWATQKFGNWLESSHSITIVTSF